MRTAPSPPCGAPTTGRPPHPLRFRLAVPEHPYAIWVLTSNRQARYLEFSRAFQASTHDDISWTSWRAVQIHHAGQHLQWPSGLTYHLDELHQDEQSSSRHSLVRVTALTSARALYRPLMPIGISYRLTGSLTGEVLRRYGIDAAHLDRITQCYAAPPPLLQRRLLDLAWALEQGYGLDEPGVRDLLRWHWHVPTRRTTARWPTPLATIEAGDLTQVEATLYPHLPIPPWQ